MYRLSNAPFRWLALPLLLTIAACSDSADPVDLPDEEPVITVEGVQDGAEYTDPVTIDISVDPGTYSARLNGVSFLSGQQVSEPGDHTLVVEAVNGLATATRTVQFAIVEPPRDRSDVLTVRLLALGDNDAGGGGDAVLLSDSSAAGIQYALVDAGPGGAAGSNQGLVAQRLQAMGVDTLLFAQLTHAHSDHFQGLDEVLEGIHVRQFVYNGQVRSYWEYQNLLTTAEQEADTVITLTEVREQELGQGPVPTTITMVPPLSSYLGMDTSDGTLLNEGSIGTSITRPGFRMLLTGDGEFEANQRWRQTFGTLTGDLDVLKAAHHGSNDAVFDNGFSGASSWLEHADPETVVISSNGTTHPRLAALDALMNWTDDRTYCTHVHGDITVRVTAEGIYDVAVERNADMNCVAGSEATS